MTRKIEMTGKVFGRWTVIGEGKFYQRRILYWICKCNCSAETVREVVGSHLRNGSSISCGCIQKEKLRARNVEDSPGRRIVRAREGKNYIPSTDYWFKQCKGCWERAKRKGIPIEFLSPHEFATYCKSIAPEICPVFGVRFKRGNKGYNHWSPSVDKIEPKIGYVRGNIQIISNKANSMKQDATPEELTMFANWVGLQKRQHQMESNMLMKTERPIDPHVDKLVADYRLVRDFIKAMEKRQAEELEEYKLALKKLEGQLLQFLDYHHQEMARTAEGTVSATITLYASLQDPDVFMDFVVEHGRHDLLDRRANSTACQDFAKENNGVYPPGVRINLVRRVSVRAPTSEKAA